MVVLPAETGWNGVIALSEPPEMTTDEALERRFGALTEPQNRDVTKAAVDVL